MKIRIKNASNLDFNQFLPLLKSFLPFAMRKMGFDQAPSIVFASDTQNAELPLGKTANYEPGSAKITIFTDKRHPKDILRSLSHELVHHKQNCGGEFSDFGVAEEGYTQNDPHLRGLEEEAYSLGNMTFRDWEDTHKKQLQESTYYNQPNLAGDTKMNTKDWKNLEINNLLMERWGYKKENLEEKHDCNEAHPDQSHEEYMESKKLEEGEVLQEDGVTVHQFAQGDNVSSVLNKYGIPAGMEQQVVDYHNWRAQNAESGLAPIEDINKIAVGGNLMIPGEQAMAAIEAGDYNKPAEAAPVQEQDMTTDLPEVDLDAAPDLQTAIDTNVDTSIPEPAGVEPDVQIDDDIKTATMSESQLRSVIREALNKAFNR